MRSFAKVAVAIVLLGLVAGGEHRERGTPGRDSTACIPASVIRA
jgi:hypothetical protein